MTGLNIAPGLTLPLEAVTETFAILAVKRAGKSNAAVVMAEEMYDAGVPWVAVDPKGDWWGVRAAGDGESPGLSVLVLGGLHGDVPLEPTAGRLVADLVAEKRLTCVLDVSEMTKADQRRFLTDFAERLYRRNTEPLHVFCEEADEYIPQMVRGEAAKVVGAFETLVKRGGFRGIGITLVTQRSASLNKDVLTQAGTLIAMRTPSPQDRKAVLAWIDYHAASKDVVDQLPELEAGEAWVFSPQWLKTLEKIRFRRRRTFDSGATPKVGGRPRPPARLADVDLAAIKEEMAETIERAKADDPRELRRRIAQLEKELRDRPTPEPIVERVEVPVVDGETLQRLEDMLSPATAALGEVQEAMRVYWNTVQAHATPAVPPRQHETPRSNRVTDPPTARPVNETGQPDVHLKAGARRILETLARHYPMRVTKAQLGTLAKFKITGGTFGTYWSMLKRHGLVDETDGLISITDTGLAYVGDAPRQPLTTDEVLAQWRDVLKAGARWMLDELVDLYPAAIDRDGLARLVQMAPSGGTYGTYLGTLRRNGLITVDGGQVRASDSLFLGGRS